MSALRDGAKLALERILARGGVAGFLAAPRPEDVLILAYHNIRPDGAAPAGDRPLHLSVSQFRRQLDQLRSRHAVVPLAEVLEPPRDGRARVAITFDDAYQGAVALGVPELVARGLPATIFVTPEFLGGRAFWWDALSGASGLPGPVRTRALELLSGDDLKIRTWAQTEGLTLLEPPSDCRGASEAEMRQAAASPGITLASHTWSHPNLARLGPAELAGELTRPLAWLRERFSGVLPWLSYPYGSWSPAVAEAAGQAGYEAALRVEGGWFRPGRDSRLGMPRLNIPGGISDDGFALRLAGLFCR